MLAGLAKRVVAFNAICHEPEAGALHDCNLLGQRRSQFVAEVDLHGVGVAEQLVECGVCCQIIEHDVVTHGVQLLER